MRNFGSITLIICLLSLLFSASRCSEKNETKTAFTSAERPIKIKKQVLKKIEYEGVGYLEYYDTLGMLQLKEGAKDFFQRVIPAKSYNLQSKGHRENSRYLTLETQNFFFKLKKEKNRDRDYRTYRYWGFEEKVNGYLFEEILSNGVLEFGALCFLDSLSNKAYQIVSIGDGSVQNLISSENGTYLAYCSNEMVSGFSTFIGILKVDTTRREKKYLTEFCSYRTDRFYIEDMRWSGDSMLVLNTVEFDEKRTYYEAKLP